MAEKHSLEEGYDKKIAYLALKATLGAAAIYFVYSSSLLPFILGVFAGGIAVTVFGVYTIGSASIEGWEAIINLFDWELLPTKLLTKQNLIKLASDLIMFKLSQKDSSEVETEQSKPTLDNLFSDIAPKNQDSNVYCHYCDLSMSNPIVVENKLLHERCIDRFCNGGKKCYGCEVPIVNFKHWAIVKGRSYHKKCVLKQDEEVTIPQSIICGKCTHISPTEGCCADRKAPEIAIVGPSGVPPEGNCCFCGTQCPSNERLHGRPFHENCRDIFLKARFQCHGCHLEVINVPNMENRNGKLYHRDCLP